MAVHFPQKSVQLQALALSLVDIAKIYERLQLQVAEQAEIEVSRLARPTDKTEQEFGELKNRYRQTAFGTTVTIAGRDGSALFGTDATVFTSPNLPDKVARIYMTNITSYEIVANRRPTNAFELTLDLSKPPLLDANNLVSSPTPNNSNLRVQGDRDAWVASVLDAVLGMTQQRSTRRSWIHRAFAYDIGLWVIGLPLAMYVCWKVSPAINASFAATHPFLSGAAYLYLVGITVWVYRILFGYTKWAFPTVELTDNKDAAGKHRAFWGVIIFGLLVNMLSEIVLALT